MTRTLDTQTAPDETPAADTPAVETPRQTRGRLNQMDRWLREHTPALTDAGHGPALVRLLGLFELAYTADHADYLEDELRHLA